FFTIQMVAAIGRNDRGDAAILHPEGPHVHALAAHTNAPIAEDAARAIEINGRRPLLLFAMLLGFDVEAFSRAILERHVLQLALAAGVAHGAVEWVIAEQQLDC